MFKFLETFVIVYETRSFSLAADQLFITQPTVSNQIKQLEEQVGSDLFIRQKKREVIPTKAADVLYKGANELIDIWTEVGRDIDNIEGEQRRMVEFGISQTVSRVMFSKIMGNLENKYGSKNDFLVKVSNSDDVLYQLVNHKIDIGMIEKPLVTEGIKRISVADDQLVRAGYQTGVWITRESGSGIGYYTDQYLREESIQPKKIIQVNNSGLIKQLLADGVGESIISNQDIPEKVPTIEIGNHFSRSIYLIVRDSDYHDKKFAELVEEIVKTSN